MASVSRAEQREGCVSGLFSADEGHLTKGYAPEVQAKLVRTLPGQAHFAGDDAAPRQLCRDCVHWDEANALRSGPRKGWCHCLKARALAGRYLERIPGNAQACRYWERR